MKNISITPENAQIIDEYFAQLQAGCTTRTLSYMDLAEASRIAESMLERLLRKQSRQNILALVKPKYMAFKPEYRGVPEHTQCYIKRGRKYWYLSSIMRTKADRSGSYKVEIIENTLNTKHDEIIRYVTNDLLSDG
ncbi:hypothetical protein [Pseudoalteromonas spongiae]|uniref:Uncharacterized protein n=1 Tax=Pseudoalteromonas spongiae TaxID=298657 RepID=A0ABU8ETP4_9GAMM